MVQYREGNLVTGGGGGQMLLPKFQFRKSSKDVKFCNVPLCYERNRCTERTFQNFKSGWEDKREIVEQ